MSRTALRLAVLLLALLAQPRIAAALTVLKADSPDPVAPGATLTYTIDVTNEGPADETNVSLSDTLPAGTTFVSLTSPAGWSCSTPAAGAGGTVTCTIATLPLESAAFGLTVRVGAGVEAGTILANTVTVASDGGEVSDTVTTTVGVENGALSLSIADSPDPVAVGATLTYTIVTSTTLTDATDYVFSFPVPAGTTFQSFSTSSGSGLCSTPAEDATGTVTCTENGFPPGSRTYTIGVEVGPGFAFGEAVEATASVRVVTDGRDAVASDDEETALLFPATLTATKTASGAFAPGGSVVYTIVLANSGPAAQGDYAGDELTDVLPAGLVLTGASATSGTATANLATGTVTWNGAIPANGSVTITINASIPESAERGTAIGNQGTLAYDADGNGTNEAAGVTDDPGVGGAADPTTITLTGIAAVPALGEVGLALLALLLGALGAVLLRRRAGA